MYSVLNSYPVFALLYVHVLASVVFASTPRIAAFVALALSLSDTKLYSRFDGAFHTSFSSQLKTARISPSNSMLPAVAR